MQISEEKEHYKSCWESTVKELNDLPLTENPPRKF